MGELYDAQHSIVAQQCDVGSFVSYLYKTQNKHAHTHIECVTFQW